MKKRILSGIFAFAFLVTVGMGVDKSMKNDTQLNNLALTNVEALASSESGNLYCNYFCSSWPYTFCYIETTSAYIYCMEKYPK